MLVDIFLQISGLPFQPTHCTLDSRTSRVCVHVCLQYNVYNSAMLGNVCGLIFYSWMAGELNMTHIAIVAQIFMACSPE